MNAVDLVRARTGETLIVRKRRWSWPAAREKLVESGLVAVTIFSGAVILFIIFFVVEKAVPVLRHNGLSFILGGGWDQQFYDAWVAGEADPQWCFGAFPLIAGTVLTTGGALTLTVPLGTGCAVFLAELAPYWLRRPVESMVRLLAGIPSVVFGLIGLLVVVPFIRARFISDALALRYIEQVALDGQCILAGTVVLTFMILPFFITLATDAINAVPRSYKEGSLALGVTHWRTIKRLLLPVAAPGIVAGAILAAARAVGEAIALAMVCGSVAFLPNPGHGLVFFLEPARTLASTIVDNAEGMGIAPLESALFGLGTLILFASLVLSLLARLTFTRLQKGVQGR